MVFLRGRKYPVVRQYDQIDCGPAALLSVLKYYGGNSSVVHIRELSNTTVDGSTMLDIVAAAKSLGFDAYGASGEYDDLKSERMPCIAHVVIDNQLHFVVIYAINSAGVLLGDPARGLSRRTRQEFLSIWKSKAVILLHPTGELTNHSAPSWLRWLASYLRREANWIYQTIFLGIIFTIIGLLTSVFIQKLIDQYIPKHNVTKILYTGIFLLTLALIRVLAGYFRERFLITLNKNISVHINSDFIEHLFKLPKKFFDTRKTGDITSRIGDAMKIQQAVLQVIGVTIIDGLIIVSSVAFIFLFSQLLAFLALALVPVYSLLLLASMKKIKGQQYEVMKAHAVVESKYIDSIRGIDEILGYSSADSFSFLNKSLFRLYQEKLQGLGLTQARLNLTADGVSSLIVVCVLIFGAYSVVQGKFLLGEMMASYALLVNTIPSISRLVYSNITLQGASVASARLMDLFLVETEKNLGAQPFHMDGAIRIADGSFSWNRRDNLFTRINLTIPRGRITALWGPSGSGKSTIVNILQRKYELDNGALLVDQAEASEIELNSYRRSVGVVPQQIKVFNASLLENILLGRPLRTVAEVDDRVREMGLGFFLDRFEAGGLGSRLGEDGRHLSGGELQILGLVRALYDKPRLLIIDEGLSGVDTEIEGVIYDVMKRYSATNAVFLITHNLNSLLKTDYLYLMANREIVQEGHPLELIAEAGLLKSLVELQFNNNEVLSNV